VRRKTVRRSQEHPQGGMIDVERPVHISNVMLQERYDARRGGRAAAVTPAAPESVETAAPPPAEEAGDTAAEDKES